MTVSMCGRRASVLGVEPPHAGERRIVQPQPAVAAEHGDRLGEVVERLALHADQRVEAALEIEPFGDVVEQIDHAAFRIGRGDDAQVRPSGRCHTCRFGSIAR